MHVSNRMNRELPKALQSALGSFLRFIRFFVWDSHQFVGIVYLI